MKASAHPSIYDLLYLLDERGYEKNTTKKEKFTKEGVLFV
jgi:hypothetical protein